MRRPGLLIFLTLVALVPLFPAFYLTMGSYIGLYSMAALGLVLLTGVAGLTSFGQAAFMGLGAYTTAVLTTRFACSPWLTLLIALALTAAIAYLLGALTLRMGGHYLPLATISWGISLYFLFGTIPALGGSSGITDIKPLSCDAKSAEVAFKQEYGSLDYRDSVEKVLSLQQVDGVWKIVRETVTKGRTF